MLAAVILALAALALATAAAASSMTTAHRLQQTAVMARVLTVIPRRCPDCGHGWDDGRDPRGPCAPTHRAVASLLLPLDIA
ncbi:hypothetical protein I6A84_32995 [Frankia sp. CNm7]|uniref:Secreted protein n=1 Tax=Frankia nepalensis TaxID=1836974 RepID=A0A937RGA3_9ACTN|nr:hypothetical protein [Frankia nepalensis]MBL7500208.1 hypothetical protein [Frankia nepalensis]MBL7509412.1 hypothetical protein [Frankia nepalensis]MBL7522776.1 hypothetical protein [Frankia nepalensis]MBL7631638.1 hypothetical protein [Frankia nepalensis]